MTDQQTMERVQQEVHSANHDKLYQATLEEVETNLSDWSEKEFGKVYEILNDNPLGR